MRKRKKKQLYENLRDCVVKHTNKFWLPKNLKKKTINTNSWFDIEEYYPKRRGPKNRFFNIHIEVDEVEKMHKCEKVTIHPTKIQKQILDKWMEAYLRMYNMTIYFFRYNRFIENKTTLNWKCLRTKYLKYVRNKIKTQSQLTNVNYDTKIYIHSLDFAIQHACANYKSCLTNYTRGNIKRFRLRYIKRAKKSFVIKFEKSSVRGDSFYPKIFGNHIKCGSKFKMSSINSDFCVHYNAKINKYVLLNPIKITQQNCRVNDGNTVSIDPGIRTFATLFSNNKCATIGNNMKQKVQTYLNKIDKVSNNPNKEKKIKNKVKIRYHKKISNVIDDLHWKTINYLTNNYDNILIGNLSTLRVTSKSLILILSKLILIKIFDFN
jgi:hypothetical protein